MEKNSKNERKTKVKKNTKKNVIKIDEMDPKIAATQSQFIFEEKIKIFLAVILFILFLLLFTCVAWYFLTQLDATLVNKTSSLQNNFIFIK